MKQSKKIYTLVDFIHTSWFSCTHTPYTRENLNIQYQQNDGTKLYHVCISETQESVLTEILSQVNTGLMVYIPKGHNIYTVYPEVLVVTWFCSHSKVH